METQKRKRRGPYGGMTRAEYVAKLDQWVVDTTAAFARQTPAQREARRLLWRRTWDSVYAAAMTAHYGKAS